MNAREQLLLGLTPNHPLPDSVPRLRLDTLGHRTARRLVEESKRINYARAHEELTEVYGP